MAHINQRSSLDGSCPVITPWLIPCSSKYFSGLDWRACIQNGTRPLHDGRPAVVLVMDVVALPQIVNMNRKRAAAITRLLLCDDILSRPISLKPAASGGTIIVKDPAV